MISNNIYENINNILIYNKFSFVHNQFIYIQFIIVIVKLYKMIVVKNILDIWKFHFNYRITNNIKIFVLFNFLVCLKSCFSKSVCSLTPLYSWVKYLANIRLPSLSSIIKASTEYKESFITYYIKTIDKWPIYLYNNYK